MIKSNFSKEETMKKSGGQVFWIICLLNECAAKGDKEGKTIHNLIRQILNESQRRNMESVVVLVNNASTDNTLEVLQNIEKLHPRQIVVLDEPKQGKARAERCGINYVISNVDEKNCAAIITMDADGEHPVEDIFGMYEMYQKEKAICVVGSRFMKSGKRNKKDEILRSLLLDLLNLPDSEIPDDPRCGARVYQLPFIKTILPRTVATNYGLQYEIVAWGLKLIKEGQIKGRILSYSLENYEPQRSKVFKKKPQLESVNPELLDLCRVLSNVFGKKKSEKEGEEIIANFGKKQGRPNLFEELSDLFFKGKMVTDHHLGAPSEFMETPQ